MPKKGNIPWNKGLTKETDERVLQYGLKHSKIMKRKHLNAKIIVWNKGLTKENDERVKKIADKYPKNRKKPILTNEQREFKRKLFTGENNPNFNPSKSDYKKYKILCQFKFNLGNFPEEFNLNKIQNMWHPFKNLKGNVRDHIYPIRAGFDNNISLEIIKHPANCQIISFKKNAIKNKYPEITIEDLYNNIKKWEVKYGKLN